MMKEEIHIWLNQIENDAIVPQEIIALNFGIYETEKGYCVYLVGAREYDATDDSWAEETENVPYDFFLEIETHCSWNAFQEQIMCVLTDELNQRVKNPSSPFYDKIITTGFDEASLTRLV